MIIKIRRYLFLLFIAFSFLSSPGCGTTIPKDALKLSPESLEKRSLQTRKYEGISEESLLSASAGVMQDLGFNIDESETRLGVIVGSKERDAKDTGQIIGAVLLAALTGAYIATDEKQMLRISLVIRPVSGESNDNHFVRVTFQRTVLNTTGQITRTEGLDNPEFYEEFFQLLSKAIFLEGQNI